MDPNKPGKPELHAVPPSQRIVSVDALRGFDMFWIAGGGPLVMAFCKLFRNPLPPWLDRQFDHVEWEGFVGWDLIMPLTISHTPFAGLAKHMGLFGEFLLASGAFGILWVGLYYMYRKQAFVRI